MPLDEADKKAIAAMMAEALKPVLTQVAALPTAEAVTKMVEQGAAKQIEALKLDEKIAAVKPKDPEVEPDRKSGKAADPELAKLQAQTAALQRQLEESKKTAEAEKAARDEQERIGALRSELGKAGVPADRIDTAVAVLHHAGQRLRRTTDGKPGLHYQRTGYEEVVPLDVALKEYLGTDAGKQFLPPTGGAGTGDGAGRAQPPNGETVSLSQLAAMAMHN